MDSIDHYQITIYQLVIERIENKSLPLSYTEGYKVCYLLPKFFTYFPTKGNQIFLFNIIGFIIFHSPVGFSSSINSFILIQPKLFRIFLSSVWTILFEYDYCIVGHNRVQLSILLVSNGSQWIDYYYHTPIV